MESLRLGGLLKYLLLLNYYNQVRGPLDNLVQEEILSTTPRILSLTDTFQYNLPKAPNDPIMADYWFKFVLGNRDNLTTRRNMTAKPCGDRMKLEEESLIR
jgi:hypothetical protein